MTDSNKNNTETKKTISSSGVLNVKASEILKSDSVKNIIRLINDNLDIILAK